MDMFTDIIWKKIGSGGRMKITLEDDSNLLSAEQKTLLENCASDRFKFKLEDFEFLELMLRKTNVDVIIEPGIVERPVSSYLDEAEEFWREEANRLEHQMGDDESKRKEYHEARNNVEKIQHERRMRKSMPLRGLYDRDAKEIKLYPEEMKQEYEGKRMEELLVSTFVHETMHAYFDRQGHECYPYAMFIEEPLAEFGMLLYLKETNSDYYDWAYNDVKSKNTCYSYGTNLMDMHLKEGPNSSIRQYLEAYKIMIDSYSMPDFNPVGGSIILPKKHLWKKIFSNPPSYFYDKPTQTIGFDGDWSSCSHINHRHRYKDVIVDVDVRVRAHGYSNPIKQIYLGDNFTIDHYHFLDNMLSKSNVDVSPDNKQFYEKQGVLFYKKDDTPVLSECGDNCYELFRNGKWGVVDAQLNQIVPFKYDCVWSFDDNGFLMVRNDNLYGLVNKQGEEQVPLTFNSIKINSDRTYTVERGGREFIIDKDGNRVY